MVYIDSKGNVLEKKTSIFSFIITFLTGILLFFKSLFGLDSSTADANTNRDHLRRSGGSGGGGGRWPGSGGPGGPGRYDGGGGTRRQIGRLPQSSGMSCPPMGGG